MTCALHMVGGAPAGAFLDPHWDYVVLLYHFEGPNNQPGPFTDSSKYAHASTANGTFDFDTDFPAKFGSSCAYANGDDDFLSMTAPGTDFVIGTKDFTIETFFKKNDSRSHCIIEFRGSGAGDAAPALFCTSGNVLAATQAGVTILVGTTLLVHRQWHHVAWSRRAGVSRLFLDGVKEAEVADTFNYSFVQPAGRPRIGRSESGGSDLQGWLDEFRITIGAGRYDVNFTPPTAAFPSGHY